MIIPQLRNSGNSCWLVFIAELVKQLLWKSRLWITRDVSSSPVRGLYFNSDTYCLLALMETQSGSFNKKHKKLIWKEVLVDVMDVSWNVYICCNKTYESKLTSIRTNETLICIGLIPKNWFIPIKRKEILYCTEGYKRYHMDACLIFYDDISWCLRGRMK